MVEGRHFERGWLSWRQLGARLAAINLSDIAAMGARPRFALMSLAVPGDVSARAVRHIELGAARELARYNTVIVGGNLTATEGPLVCDMTLLGTCQKGRAWRRRARAGDAIVVAGELGAAAAGVAMLQSGARRPVSDTLVRAYARPVPRLDVVAALRKVQSVHGAIDISDGLSSDLIHLCQAARVGCEITLASLPVPRSVVRYCQARHEDPVRWAMDAGEDYALILSIASKRAADVCRRVQQAGVRATVIGHFTRQHGVYRMVGSDGRRRRFRPGGWDHFRRAAR
jgi:thiamine-monophosphate kinase